MKQYPQPDIPKCDFCSAFFPVWIHWAKPFIIEQDKWASDDEWAACDKYHRMILEGDAEGLAHRCYNTLKGVPKEDPAFKAEILPKILRMHAGFWDGRDGRFRKQGHTAEGQHRRERW